MVVYLVLLLSLEMVTGKYISLKIKKISQLSGFDESSLCAAEMLRVKQEAVRYSKDSKTCSAISTSDIDYDSQDTFYKLLVTRFSCAKKDGHGMSAEIPMRTRIGSSIMFDLKLGKIEYRSYQVFTVDLLRDKYYICFHMSVRFHENRTVLNHRKYVFGEQLHLPLILDQSHTTAQLRFVVQPDGIQIYKNGNLFSSFNYRVPIDECDKIVYSSSNGGLDCQEIETVWGPEQLIPEQ